MLETLCIFLIIMDTIQTYHILKIDIRAEANPIIRFIYSKFNMVGVIAFKLSLIILLLTIKSEGCYVIMTVIYGFAVLSNCYWFFKYNKIKSEIQNGKEN